ncbi:VOC family protein [Psychrobacillus sp. INOP01]|uniref:VOC family protein n=1 Tax=Psychrobacillus sp. INOP01 TaxID=2829187 RepID=UPI001BAA3C80|nr:VOC family protein [Psychrobacillus sp. INOP01]QUG43170.1 VOC family protein [Psychrobacillus sp. INOP01]
MKLGQVSVNVVNVDRAVAFYKDVVKLVLLFEMDSLAFFQCGETRLLLSRPESEEFNHPSSVLYFQVDDLNSEVSRMKDAGATFIDEPHMVAKVGETETWMAFFKDTEGNTHALMNES